MLAVLVLGALLMAACTSDPGVNGPSILVITADDLGRHLGSYGDDTIGTPNIDAIAARGTLFSRAYVTAPSCSASRASFLTGLYPHQHGQIGLAHYGFTMTEHWPTIPGLLRQQRKYYAALGGKLHVNPTSAFAFFEPWEHDRDDHWTMDIDIVGATAARYFKQAEGRPFYIQFDLRDPHRPFVARRAGQPASTLTRQQVEPFSWGDPKQANLGADTAAYYNSVARLDAIVGRILAELRNAGRLDETIIVFWSDNGPPFSRAKGTLYEQGIRVPLLISGPGIKAGQVRDELVSTIDLMPTLLAMTAIELPANRQAYPGRDLGPLLRGEQVAWREYLFTELTFHTPDQWSPARAVTDGRWKLVHNLAAEKPAWRIRLYDLVADPEERVNLANRSSKKKQRERLENLLLQWRASTGDPLLDSGTYDRLAQIPLDPGQSILPWYQPP